MLKMMQRRILQLVACVFFLLVALTPVLECFDGWDGPTTPMTDTELRVTAWLIVAGTVGAVMQIVRAAARVASVHRWIAPALPVNTGCVTRTQEAVLSPSPPIVPLRI